MRLVSLFILSILLIGENGLLSAQEWLQWGGSDGNFKIESAKLNENWPTAGPVQKWRRPLGEGY